MSSILPLTLFAFTATITPGPNNTMLLASGLRFGPRKTLPHLFGVAFGFFIMMMCIALGFGTLFTHHPWLQDILKYAGSGYLIWLAWQIYHSTNNPSDDAETARPMKCHHAMAFQWANPKAVLMAISTSSLFTLHHNPINNALLIGAIYFVICLICAGFWAFLGAALQKMLKTDSHRQLFNTVMAGGLLLSVTMILFK